MMNILFIIRDFKQGGIPRCLQSLMPMIDSDRYSIDLLCLQQDGPYKNQMGNCVILEQDKVLYHLLKFGVSFSDIMTLSYKAIDKILNMLTGKSLIKRRIDSIASKLSGKYDVVIAYSEGIAAQLASKIAAKKRIVWIHNDYSFDCARGDSGTSFESFDKIVCVSNATRKSFVNKFPQYSDKSVAIYNIINQDFIISSSIESNINELSDNDYNVVSVGRICYQKNFELIPEILTNIDIKLRKQLKWFIIGDGPENEVTRLKQIINMLNLEDSIILLGPKDNPYPYIRNANLFVLTSRYESYPTVINEALVLQTKVISVNIPSAYEMLDKTNIVEPKDMPDRIALALLYPDKHLFEHIDVKSHNDEVMKSFYNLFN